MWDCNFQLDRLYNVSVKLLDGLLDKEELYTLCRSDEKFRSLREAKMKNEDYKYGFRIERIVKEKWKWYAPFRHREIVDIVLRCVNTELFCGNEGS